jgi:hypothetical protein
LGVTGARPLGVITAVAVAILGLATAVVRNGVLAGTPLVTSSGDTLKEALKEGKVI